MSGREIHNHVGKMNTQKMRKRRDHNVSFDENKETKHSLGSSNGLWICEHVLACKYSKYGDGPQPHMVQSLE